MPLPMPVIDNTRKYAGYDKLLKRLVAEWKSDGDAPAKPDSPTIRLEGKRPGYPSRIYVTWSAWRELDAEARTLMILDACEEVLGLHPMMGVAIAVGVAPGEAGEGRVKFDPSARKEPVTRGRGRASAPLAAKAVGV